MCGRYAITSAPEAIRALFGHAEAVDFPPRYNVAPTQPVPVVRLFEGQRQLVLMRWGLVPAWVKDPREFSLLVMGRAEGVLDKPAFRSAMRYRRCLLPADGFYEWKRGGASSQPWFIRRRDGGPLALAGLWETWMGPNGEEMDSVAVITTTANGTVAPVHDRMPVIVPPEAFDAWLDCRAVDAQSAAALMVPAPDTLLEAYPVSRAVNSAKEEGPGLIAPSPPEQAEPAAKPARARKSGDDRQASLF